jgi:tRNA-2-methylthio-N6-dimethylallyladenosine synthase
VLKAMNRHYTRADYLRLVEALRQVRPGISITTDIMVGFPGETEQDFEDTLSLVEEVGFNSAFSFIYSARPHTPAAAMEQIDEDIKHERFDRLLELLNRLSLADHQSLVGTKRSILLEGLSKQDPWVLTGRDSEFHLINVPLEPGKLSPEMQDGDGLPNADYFEGRFMKVEITEAKTFSLEAKSLD